MPMNNEGQYGNLIMQDCILPPTHSKPEVIQAYERFGKRVHWIDKNNMPGAFQMNTCWYKKANREFMEEGKGIMTAHAHDCAEILGFYGSNPEDPFDLGGEVEFHINGEPHILTRSSMIFLPAGIPHCPLVVNRVERPIFHFSVVMAQTYSFIDPNSDFKFEAK